MKSWIRRSRHLIIIFLLAFLTLTVLAWYQLNTPMFTTPDQPIIVDIDKGTSLTSITQDLEQRGLLRHPVLLIIYAKLMGYSRTLQAGEYAITNTTTPREFLSMLVDGQVILRQFTIVNGWTFAKLIDEIRQNTYLKHLLTSDVPKEVMSQLGYGNMNPEAQFYPDTYLFGRGRSDILLLHRSHEILQNTLNEEWTKRDKAVPYKTKYQALIAASLIEKETSLPGEYTQIAGVIVRRLAKNMYLQIDPTVIYALGKHYDGKITRTDLRVNSPYNTYLHKGLPPGPIAMASRAAIYAALHPAPGNALYFVAKGDGSHIFSATLKEHNQAVRDYILHIQPSSATQSKVITVSDDYLPEYCPRKGAEQRARAAMLKLLLGMI